MEGGHTLLHVGNGLSGVQVLRAGLAAVHDGVAAVELEGVVQLLDPLSSDRVTAVFNPPIRLHEDGRSEVGVRSPPVRRTGRAAAGAQDALVHAVELLAVALGLQVLASSLVCLRGLGVFVEPGFDASVLVVEVGHVGHEVLDHVHVRQRVDLRGRAALLNVGEAREAVAPADVHRAGSADALAATAAEGQARILLVLDLDQRVQHHGTAVIQIHRVGHHVRRLFLLRIPPIDLEVLQMRSGVGALQLEAVATETAQPVSRSGARHRAHSGILDSHHACESGDAQMRATKGANRRESL
mmetsp:Transcript_737/g.2988  ORF Transcript_737/g.2988 Transcript_737/m.2988 type:complete len:298 (-) Transcript_737:19-912(-)